MGLLRFGFAGDATGEPCLVYDVQLVEPVGNLFLFIECLEFEQELTPVGSEHLSATVDGLAKWSGGEVLDIHQDTAGALGRVEVGELGLPGGVFRAKARKCLRATTNRMLAS